MSLRLFTKESFGFEATSARDLRVARTSLFWTAVVSGMVALLSVVAVLQYRWTTQVAEATDARIGSSVQSLMIDWHYDLYGEFSAVCVALQVGPDSGAHDNWQDYLQRYEAWGRTRETEHSLKSTDRNPKLVENVYIWETSRTTAPRFLRLNASANKIENYNVPTKLQELLARLKGRSSSVAVALRAWEITASSPKKGSETAKRRSASTSQRSDPITGWQFDQNIPAIVHPIIHQRDVTDQADRTIARDRVDWIIISLDLQTLQEHTLPDLTNRYFGTRQGPDYKVAVVLGGDPHRSIYSSDHEFGVVDPAKADATMNVFGPPPESGEGHFWQAATNGNSLKSAEWHSFSGPVWFPTIQYVSQQEPWVLTLQHRNGPLDAVVKEVRRRNLSISIIVLLLLAANMALVVIASHRAQKLAKLQMDFVASVSHELRTPLTAIFSAGENIQDGFVEGSSNLKFYGSIVTSQARQLMDLVDRILLFASLRSSKNQYVLRPLQVSQILQGVRKSTAAMIESAAYTIEEQIEPGLPWVIGDLSAICGCLQNLVTNAVKYSEEDRCIRLFAAVHETDGHRKEIRISVQDHGMGISTSELPHIFEPFYRSPKVVAAQIHGTGLGLSLAKRLALAMGGRLSVVSEVGVGSIFTLHLPVAQERECELTTVSSGSHKGVPNE